MASSRRLAFVAVGEASLEPGLGLDDQEQGLF